MSVEEARLIDQKTISELVKEVQRLEALLPRRLIDQSESDNAPTIADASNGATVNPEKRNISEQSVEKSAPANAGRNKIIIGKRERSFTFYQTVIAFLLGLIFMYISTLIKPPR